MVYSNGCFYAHTFQHNATLHNGKKRENITVDDTWFWLRVMFSKRSNYLVSFIVVSVTSKINLHQKHSVSSTSSVVFLIVALICDSRFRAKVRTYTKCRF